MQTILEIDNVKKKYGKTQVLNGISLKVEEGEIISVLGPSGCGKSTLLRMPASFLWTAEACGYAGRRCPGLITIFRRKSGESIWYSRTSLSGPT